MFVKYLISFISLLSLINAQSFIGCVDNLPSDTNQVDIEGDCDSSCKNEGYEYAFWSITEKECQCGNSPPKTFMYNMAQDEYGKCLPYDYQVTKTHIPFQFHLCTKTIDLTSTSNIKSRQSIVDTMSECFESCSEADYIAVAPQWAKTTYECKCGGMPISYNPITCGEGSFYGFSNPSSKGNRSGRKSKSKPQRLGKQRIEQVIPGKGGEKSNRYDGL